VKPRVVLDTNIYISAIIYGGKPEEIFLLAKQREIILFVSTAILAEVAAKLTDKFRWNPADVADFIREIGESATVLRPEKVLKVIREAEADNRVLECALLADADYIVSGDRRHLLSLRQYEGIKIVSAAKFLRKMGKG